MAADFVSNDSEYTSVTGRRPRVYLRQLHSFHHKSQRAQPGQSYNHNTMCHQRNVGGKLYMFVISLYPKIPCLFFKNKLL